MSMVVSFMSAVGMLGTAAEIYEHGAEYVTILIGIPLGCLLAAYIFVPLLYPLRLTSSLEVRHHPHRHTPRVPAGCLHIRTPTLPPTPHQLSRGTSPSS